uniref:C2H2-type domain-containing protein n=1 Tax=Eptatretus burgeri TaxID=7764 RepID=A0A8C4Q2S2_EPTBU
KHSNKTATGGNGISSMPRGPIRCEECGYNTSRYDHYLAHLKHHELAGGVKGTLHVLSCTLCPYSTVSRYHWKKHLRNHFPCKVYTCSECSYFSDRKNNYLQHMRTHTGERPYCCPHCSYRSSQKTHLTRHMRVHSGEKPFKCMQCSYVAANQHEVTRHFRQVHNGPKPFGCEHCNYRTADRSNYKKHVELHTRPRQFHCPVCHYAASKKCNLQYHIRSKHPDSNLVTMDVSHVRLRGSSRGRRGVGMSKTGIESKVTVASNTEDDVENDFKDSEKHNCDADHIAFVKKYNDDADDGMVVSKEKADADDGRAIDKDKSDVKDGAVLNEGKSDVEMGTPVDEGKSNVGMGILVGKGKRHVEKRTLVGKGKSDIGKGTTMGKGRSDVGKGTPVRKSKSGKGTPVGKVNDVTKDGDSKSSQNPDVSKSEFKECGGKLESLQGSAPRKPDTCKRHMRQKHVCAQRETSCVDGVASKREVLLEQTGKHVDQKLALCLRNNRSTGSPRKRSQQTIATEMQRSILPKRLKFSSPVTLIDLPPTEKPFVEWCKRAGLRNNLTEQQVSSRGQQECCNTGNDCLHFGNSLGATNNASTIGEGRKMKLVAERVTKDGLSRKEVELPNSSTEDSNPLDVECFASMSPEFACALRLRMVCRPRDETGIEGDSLAAAQTKDLDGPRVHGGEAVTPLIPNSEKVLSLRMTDGAIRPVFSERTSEDEGIDSDTESDSLANRCRRGLFTDSNQVIRETDQTARVNFHPGMFKQAICDGVASGGQVSCAGERKRSMCTETQHADLESLGLSDRRPKGEKAGCPSCVFCNMPFPSDKELGHHLRRHLFNVVVT